MLKSLDKINEIVDQYKKIKDYGTIEQIQNIRDLLSMALYDFGPHYADLRADAEWSDHLKKKCLAQKKLDIIEELKGKRGAVSEAESRSLIECNEASSEENKAAKAYYKAKEIIERGDQILNSVASRIRLEIKD